MKSRKSTTTFSKVFDEFLSGIDLFQQNVGLKLKKNFRVSITLGKFLSILILSLIFYNFLYSDLVQRTNPIVLQQPFEEDERLELNFTPEKILIVFGLTDDYNKIYDDPTIFTITARQAHVVNGSNTTFTEKKLENCNLKNFKRYSYLYQKMDMKGSKCLNDSFKIKGFWDEPDLYYIEFLVNRCVNNTNSDRICKSNQEINDFMEGKYFSQWVETKRFNMKNADNPISGKIKNYYKAYQKGQSRATRFYLKKVIFSSNNGIIFPIIDEVETFATDRLEDDSTPSDIQMFKFIVYSSDESLFLERRYESLFDLISNLGGFVSILVLIFSILVKQVYEWKLNELIFNKLFVFIDKKRKVLKTRLFTQKKLKINDIKSAKLSKLSDDSCTSNKENNFKKRLSLHADFQKKLTMNLLQRIGLSLKRRKQYNPKEKLYKEFIHTSDIKVDFINLLQRLEEIEKLKLILFSEKQLLVFNSLSKRQIFINDEKNVLKYKFNVDVKNLKKDEVKKVQNFIENKEIENLSELDKRILNLVR